MSNETDIESLQPDGRACSAIADAVMTAQLSMLLPFPTRLPEGKTAREFFEETLRQESRGACQVGSLIAADHLARRYQDLFSHIFLVTAEKNDTHPFKDFPDDKFTSYAFAKDHNGFWYAISPANHERTPGDSGFLNLIPQSQDLQTILDAIQMQEGGFWPTAGYIQDALSDQQMPYHHPVRSDIQDQNIDPAEFGQQIFHVYSDSSSDFHHESALFATEDVDKRSDPATMILQLQVELERHKKRLLAELS